MSTYWAEVGGVWIHEKMPRHVYGLAPCKVLNYRWVLHSHFKERLTSIAHFSSLFFFHVFNHIQFAPSLSLYSDTQGTMQYRESNQGYCMHTMSSSILRFLPSPPTTNLTQSINCTHSGDMCIWERERKRRVKVNKEGEETWERERVKKEGEKKRERTKNAFTKLGYWIELNHWSLYL